MANAMPAPSIGDIGHEQSADRRQITQQACHSTACKTTSNMRPYKATTSTIAPMHRLGLTTNPGPSRDTDAFRTRTSYAQMQEHSTEQACSTQKTPRATAHKRNNGKQGKNQQRKWGRVSLFGCSRAAAARARAGKPTHSLEPSTKDADQLADVGQRRLEAVRKGRFSASRMSGLKARPFSAPPG